MAAVMFVRHASLSADEYDRLIGWFHFDVDPPAGQILHVAAEVDGGIETCDLWMTPAAAESFVQHRLRPALRDLRIDEDFVYRIEPAHNVFVAEFDVLERIGAVSIPGLDPGAVIS
jgi:hypothetical protein